MAFRTATSRRAAVILGTLAVLIEAELATGQPGPVVAGTPTGALAAPGTNLLLNPQATVEAISAQGRDAVLIPGWQAVGGLPHRRPLWDPGISENRQILDG
jgi:hypothetical protein